MNILIIEDEIRSFKKIEKILKSLYKNCVIYGPLGSNEEIINFFNNNQKLSLDLIIADIQLGDGLVFEAFDSIDYFAPVIFTTAFNEYAIQAFKYNGIDYLLKPIIEKELEEAIERVEKKEIYLKKLCEYSNIIEREENKSFRKRFLVNKKDSYFIVEVDAISHISLFDKIVKLHLFDGSYRIIDLTLENLEEQLDPNLFFRVSRQFIVNINAIQKISVSFGRKLKLFIKNYPEIEIIVSRDKASQLKEWINQ